MRYVKVHRSKYVKGKATVKKEAKIMEKTVSISNEVKELDIHISYGELNIEDGEEFKVELEWSGDNELFLEEENGRLRIWNEREDKRIPISKKHSDIMRVNVTIPQEQTFEKVRIVSGAGTLYVGRLWSESVVVRLGAGEVQIGDLKASNFAHIEKGAGAIEIENGEIHNLKLDVGVGEVGVNAILTGTAQINAGVGELRLNLLGDAEDYNVIVKRGFGNSMINGCDWRNGNTYGAGANHVEVNGGMGLISVTFEEYV